MSDTPSDLNAEVSEYLRKSWREKGHWVKFHVPAVKIFWFITVRRATTYTKWVKCECGQSNTDRVMADIFRSSPLLDKLLEERNENE